MGATSDLNDRATPALFNKIEYEDHWQKTRQHNSMQN